MSLFERTLTADDVIWCYRHLLGREPESLKVIEEKLRLRSFRAVVKQMVSSAEFQELVASEPSLTHDDVDWCYRHLLLRSPEGASVVADKMHHQNFRSLVADIAASEEFLGGHKLSDELDKLAFQIVHGRDPDPGEFLGGYSAIRVIKVLRKRLDNGASMTDQPNLQAELGSAKSELAETQHKLLIFQTCDHERYVPILQATSQTVLEYVRRWHCDYETFIGIKKGAHPWHATFNRIYKFGELMRSGFCGWVAYLDADAYFASFDFDLSGWLDRNRHFALIAAHADEYSKHYWSINAGVFFLNLGHPVAREMISQWADYYQALYDEQDYINAPRWDMVVNDQTSLHSILKNPKFEPYVLTEGVHEIINSGGAKVIRQILREDHTSNDDLNFDRRVERIRAVVQEVLNVVNNPSALIIRQKNL
jgi:hypothetical protein